MTRRRLSKGEISPHKVAAIFADFGTARSAAEQVQAGLGLAPEQVTVLTSETRRPGRRLEPESHGIWSVLLKTHAALGTAGFLAGLLIFWTLWRSGLPLIVSSPMAAAGAIVFLTTMGGLMLGGLATLRPDHDLYILKVLEACQAGRSAAVVHARTAEERDAARAALEAANGEVVTTL